MLGEYSLGEDRLICLLLGAIRNKGKPSKPKANPRECTALAIWRVSCFAKSIALSLMNHSMSFGRRWMTRRQISRGGAEGLSGRLVYKWCEARLITTIADQSGLRKSVGPLLEMYMLTKDHPADPAWLCN